MPCSSVWRIYLILWILIPGGNLIIFPKGNIRLAFCKPLVTTFSSTNQYIQLFFICVSVLRHHIQYVFLDYFEHQNHQLKSPIHEKNVPLNRLQKTTTTTTTFCKFTVWKLKQEGRVLFCLTSGGNIYIGWLKFLAALCMSLNDWESTGSIDLGVTNKF